MDDFPVCPKKVESLFPTFFDWSLLESKITGPLTYFKNEVVLAHTDAVSEKQKIKKRYI